MRVIVINLWGFFLMRIFVLDHDGVPFVESLLGAIKCYCCSLRVFFWGSKNQTMCVLFPFNGWNN